MPEISSSGTSNALASSAVLRFLSFVGRMITYLGDLSTIEGNGAHMTLRLP